MNLTFTGEASMRIFPQETASSGRAPESEPSNSCPVLTNTAKSAPFLWEPRKNPWEFFLFGKSLHHCAFLGSYDYHEISVGDMMFDETSTQNDHPCALGKHGLAVQPPNIWSIENCHNEMTNAICEIISRLTHPPQCQALVQGSYMSGSRSYHPMSRRWGRD